MSGRAVDASSGAAVVSKTSGVSAQLHFYEAGIRLFHAGRFREARELFAQAVAGSDRGIAHRADLHARMCERRLEQPIAVPQTAEEHYNYGVALHQHARTRRRARAFAGGPGAGIRSGPHLLRAGSMLLPGRRRARGLREPQACHRTPTAQPHRRPPGRRLFAVSRTRPCSTGCSIRRERTSTDPLVLERPRAVTGRQPRTRASMVNDSPLRIVAIGGGTGLSVLLQGLKRYAAPAGRTPRSLPSTHRRGHGDRRRRHLRASAPRLRRAAARRYPQLHGGALPGRGPALAALSVPLSRTAAG